jgi:hypothetical protein
MWLSGFTKRKGNTVVPEEDRKCTRSFPKKVAPSTEQIEVDFRDLASQASRYLSEGNYEQARISYELMELKAESASEKALARNNLGALAVCRGDKAGGQQAFESAVLLDPACKEARANLELLLEESSQVATTVALPQALANNLPTAGPSLGRVAILSFLFNWPSTGGGTVHTYELTRFLQKAGYDALHIFVRHPPWGIGGVTAELTYPNQPLEFSEAEWNPETIRGRIREAIDGFGPDWVIIMDSWNFKPHLAEAVRGYSYFLRFQALECLCPLNNVRLLLDREGQFSQCPKQQLATPEDCKLCLQERGHMSGSLHQSERALSGVGTPEYHRLLCRALQGAEAVLVLNPFTEAMLSPYARRVCVVPWGMDPARFPWPPPESDQGVKERPLTRIFMAAVVDELSPSPKVLPLLLLN